ncbi:MAG: Oxidoreductase [Candidatus Nomurabacteria bacterium GW2011_GWB1_37_5]|uniref:D-lactate dehydrogenase (cytochrome) n=1 Tax=Candidatus Nomurabacteria bacterium GW2011_GWB1_37_5 TaxID=1618742 RepID=A0A0G0GUL2_9BACT|nr:MAG: Oxidoreductase [Candidatus Nomurabacteria bacterium GW2011_GWB1_37_5]
MTGGPLNESIIMDFTRYMNKLVEFGAASSRSDLKTRQGPTFSQPHITVQPGMFYRDFEKIVSEKGLMLPSYPASKSICAIGGMFSNNSGGEKTLKYGKTEDYVLSARIVLNDGNEYLIKSLTKTELTNKINQNDFEGNIYKQINELINDNIQLINDAKPKVSKNSAGYYIWNVISKPSEEIIPSNVEGYLDLNKLFVGSQGTLGIVTEITFRLVPMPENSRLAVIFLKDNKMIAKLVNEILKYDPESLEAYDDKTLKIAMRFFTSFLKGKGIWGSLKFAWSFWPDLFLLMRRGFPKLVVLAELAGSDADINDKYDSIIKYLKQNNIYSRLSTSKSDTNKYWEIRHESFNLLRKHVKGKKTAPFIDDVIVRPEFLPEFLPKLEQILSKYPELEHTIAGHPGNGNFHIIPLVDIGDPRLKKDVLVVSEKVYDLVKEYNGSITAEHNDGIIRTPFLNKMFNPEMLEIFLKIKNIFDPQNIFNPGKKTRGTKQDIAKYLSIN